MQPQPPGPRRVNVDLAELEAAFEDASWEARSYLDLETGEVIAVTDETRRELDDLYAEMYEDGDEPVIPLSEALERRNLPAWMEEAIIEADQVEAGYGTRYLEVPRIESREAYQDMEAFIPQVEDGRLQDRLWRAIRGRGAFGRFRDALAHAPQEQERWFAFKAARTRERILEWLESEGIEPT